MKAVISALVLAVASSAYAQLQVNTPASLTECEPSLINWQGGTPPYFLTLWNSVDSATTIETLANNVNSTTLTWNVNQPSGQKVGFTIKDSTGATAQSDSVAIQAGSSTSCASNSQSASVSVGTGAASSGSSGASTTGSSGASTTGSSGSSATNSPSSGSSGSSGHSTTGSAAPSTTSSSGASAQAAQFGVAGIVGVAVAALLA